MNYTISSGPYQAHADRAAATITLRDRNASWTTTLSLTTARQTLDQLTSQALHHGDPVTIGDHVTTDGEAYELGATLSHLLRICELDDQYPTDSRVFCS